MKIYLRPFILLFSIFIATVVSFGQQKVVFTPQWTAQSQFAGYYVALEKGFYKEAGLDVVIMHPSTSYSAINQIKNGECDFVTIQLLQAMQEIDKGADIVNMLQTSQNNGLLIMPRYENIRSLEDLRDKKVGIWKVGFGEFAKIIDIEQNLNIEWVPFIQNINLFISGVIDATLAMSYNEILQIWAAGYDISTAISIADEGYNFPEDGLYVSRKFLKKNPKAAKAFAEASRKGWEWTEDNPEEALEIVMKTTRENNIATNKTHQKKMLEEILRLNKDRESGSATYTLKPETINQLNDILLKHGFIENPVSYEIITGKR